MARQSARQPVDHSNEAASGAAPAASASEGAKSPGRTSRKSLDERIAHAQSLLKALEDEKRKRDAEQRADNERAVRRLLAAQGLLGLDVQTWRSAMPAIRTALGK